MKKFVLLPFYYVKGFLFDDLSVEIKKNKLILFYIIMTTPFTLLVSIITNHDFKLEFNTYLSIIFGLMFVSLLVWAPSYLFFLAIQREQKPVRKFFDKFKVALFPVSRTFGVFLLILILNIPISSYSFIKSAIPNLNFYYLDLDLYHVDKWLHFGFSPWEITHLFFTSAFSSLVINFLYHLWFFVMWLMFIYFILDRKNIRLRYQFLLTFLSSWFVIGNIMAIFLSSVGPVYFNHFYEQDYYLPLMQRLNALNTELNGGFLHLWSLDAQQILWKTYVADASHIGSGISAMPSMHVTISVLMAMASFRLNKNLGYVLWVFAFCIQIGSVHLGWHYAVDGYVGALSVAILWHFIGYLLRRYLGRVDLS
ncbi:phosphatase PAP2 family protein [Vibrio splendidus]|uniref:phosphatase PAP2 family protein n=1 Tax=Vibrio splendidus TaxID=29497 RepID=UPI000C831230|nr:phosphatase PAP2 family protein [Vibrio splendidus]PMI77451.1 hypothetical protein BCU38_24140 [Vibrio splendidus]